VAGLIEIAVYADDPCRPEPDWSTLQPANDDVVLAVNYFGIRSGEPWRRWHEKRSCFLLEDHSHDPVSGWALHSRADYAFSSLRKRMPVPDGAILWSPKREATQRFAVPDMAPSLSGSSAILTDEAKTGDRVHNLTSLFDRSHHWKSGNWGQNR
jgi:hypothetical protein